MVLTPEIEGIQYAMATKYWEFIADNLSIVTYELKSNGSGAHLVFDHTGFPENLRDHLARGWQAHYWDPLTKFLR